MTYRRGDVVLVRFPNSNLKTYKNRPALVVQADGVDTGLSQRILAMITSNESRHGETRVWVKKDTILGRDMGLLDDSCVVADNLATVLEREIDRVIGTCTQTEDVDKALRKALGL